MPLSWELEPREDARGSGASTSAPPIARREQQQPQTAHTRWIGQSENKCCTVHKDSLNRRREKQQLPSHLSPETAGGQQQRAAAPEDQTSLASVMLWVLMAKA